MGAMSARTGRGMRKKQFWDTPWHKDWPNAHVLDLGSMTLQTSTSSSNSILVPIKKPSQKEKRDTQQI